MRGPEATVKKAVGVGEDEDILENDNSFGIKFGRKESTIHFQKDNLLLTVNSSHIV